MVTVTTRVIGWRSDTDDELNSRLPAWYTKCCQANLAYDIYLASESSARSSLAPSCPLQGENALSVTRVHSCFGDRCFAAAGPRIWNNLTLPVCETRKSAAQNSENN